MFRRSVACNVNILLRQFSVQVICSIEIEKMSSIELPGEIIRTALNKTAEDLLKTSAFELIVTPGSAKGDNFVGDCYRVACRKSSDEINDEHEAELKLFVKIAPQHKQRRNMFSSQPCFLQEIHVFNKVGGDFHLINDIQSCHT